MANDEASSAYDDLVLALEEDEDYDVAVAADGLLVRGTLFAFLEGDDLVVELPEARANDLKSRGVAQPFEAGGSEARKWVRVSDLQLWPELARESHEYVGEPPVGGES